jgi:hypothetical protein
MDSPIKQKPGIRRTKKKNMFTTMTCTVCIGANQKTLQKIFCSSSLGLDFDHIEKALVYFRLGFRVTVKYPFVIFSATFRTCRRGFRWAQEWVWRGRHSSPPAEDLKQLLHFKNKTRTNYLQLVRGNWHLAQGNISIGQNKFHSISKSPNFQKMDPAEIWLIR